MTKHTLNPILAYEPISPKSPEPLQIKTFEYFEVTYNHERLHSANGYNTPEEFDKKYIDELRGQKNAKAISGFCFYCNYI